MTRCDEFYEKVRRDGNFCGLKEQTLKNVEEYVKFLDENPTLIGISERAAQPLIREKNPVVKAKAIEVTGRQLKHRRPPTAEQMRNRIANIEAGKSLTGGKHLGKADEKPTRKLGGYVDRIETLIEEKDIDEIDLTETIGDEVYPIIGDEAGDTGDILDIPNDTDENPEFAPEVIVKPQEIEEDVDPEEVIRPETEEITEKVVKENLKNAGHVDPVPTPERIPSEDEKQDIFNKCIKQAFGWEMNGDEIARRMEKAIMFVYPSRVEGEN